MLKNSLIIGCIYHHLSIELLEKNILRKKMVVLLGDFNADLLRYEHDEEVTDVLDAMYSKLLLTNTSSLTGITSTSSKLIDNIFTNDYENTFSSGNLVTTLSYQVTQILIIPIRNTTRHKKPKKVHGDFQEIRGKKILFQETYKILIGIWNSS